MVRPLHVVAFAGSNRRGSFNRRLLRLAVAAVGRAGGEGVTTDIVNLREHPLPLFEADLQADEGIPDAAHEIVRRVAAADAALIANPEHNGGYPVLFKNTLDWVSRVDMFLFHPRYVGLLSATPGRTGGANGAEQVRTLFGNIFVTVHADTYLLPKAHEAFTDDGLVPEHTERLDAWAGSFVAGAVAHTEARLARDAGA